MKSWEMTENAGKMRNNIDREKERNIPEIGKLSYKRER